jgi:hypothetical protein
LGTRGIFLDESGTQPKEVCSIIEEILIHGIPSTCIYIQSINMKNEYQKNTPQPISTGPIVFPFGSFAP